MTVATPTLTAYVEFASTYSYLAVMRLEEEAARAGVTVRWRPFLLGPIFKAQGWETSPFNLYPAKGRHMWRDMARRCAARGLALTRPDPFPVNGLLAARVATAIADTGERARGIRALFAAEFAEGRDIADPAVVAAVLEGVGLDGTALAARAADPAVKAALRQATDDAIGHGVFGAPSFVTADGELFWGDDRLEDALAWAAGTAVRPGRPQGA
ncbi:2-hydroxychromene-2-carboxylate isomerase [Roseospira visakhapatnamensis]|uniref:2-hydroxychromene-2-carboxylate isomerase n=1 Tax=Roseospira visakhapatnamensis TaxID=390880 RepID=A0A7W6RDF4_9PROT|nr:2-hydroxychromene-2-carboxylate isomerase [Roseospira visakhapatnamensis]MBB4266453.1 2-hydroxychromene-2-carboxylate isomerase [Roseospira visakhapatnamensis]